MMKSLLERIVKGTKHVVLTTAIYTSVMAPSGIALCLGLREVDGCYDRQARAKRELIPAEFFDARGDILQMQNKYPTVEDALELSCTDKVSAVKYLESIKTCERYRNDEVVGREIVALELIEDERRLVMWSIGGVYCVFGLGVITIADNYVRKRLGNQDKKV